MRPHLKHGGYWGMTSGRVGKRFCEELKYRIEHGRPHPRKVEVVAKRDDVVMCGQIDIAGREVKTVATVMRFDKAVDVTVAELRVELMFPADAAGAAVFACFAAQAE
jgi:hypothetical protein